MAEEIFTNYRKNVADITLISSGKGIFDVKLGDELLFSKKEVDRFPEENEVSRIIDEKQLIERADR